MKNSAESNLSFFEKFLSKIENTPSSDRLILRIVFFAVVITGIWLAISASNNYSAVTATTGGTISEGIIGTPRFVNPALAITRADQDITALVYSGLLKIGNDGSLINDIAESIVISEDGLTYDITLRSDVKFHDGNPLTAKDVVYTIQLIQDSDLKSPLRGNWTDVVVEQVSDFALKITLEEAYAPFIENFTLGIMPAHAWSSLPIEQLPFSQLNTEPIGSGPFTVINTERDTSGLINHYSLTAFRDNNVDPKINRVELFFYQNEELLLAALDKKEIDATAYLSASNVELVSNKNYQLIEVPLPRSFGIFFNKNRDAALRDTAAREALTIAIDREALIENTLFGHGVPIYGPTGFIEPELELTDSENEGNGTSTLAEKAIKILEAGDWVKNEQGLWEKKINNELITLSITVRTSNAPLFDSLVNLIAKQWEAVGVEVLTEQFDQTGLVQSVIRPRDFEALLFGLDMSRSYDMFPFWHSSQQDDPGLNIAQYTNVNVDELLESARVEQVEATRIETLRAASGIIQEEKPAVFLFQPTLTYLVNKKVTVPRISNIGKPSDRFSNVVEWHTESDSLWPIFRNDDI
jgi:peptide/nickel transport system substrate-binding protein